MRCSHLPLPVIRKDRKSTRLNSSHTDIYTLSLHDALPILMGYKTLSTAGVGVSSSIIMAIEDAVQPFTIAGYPKRSEEHTSELQSHRYLHSFPTRRSSDLDGLQNSINCRRRRFFVNHHGDRRCGAAIYHCRLSE